MPSRSRSIGLYAFSPIAFQCFAKRADLRIEITPAFALMYALTAAEGTHRLPNGKADPIEARDVRKPSDAGDFTVSQERLV